MMVPQRFDAKANSLLLDVAEPSIEFAIVHMLREPVGRIVGATLVGSQAAEALGAVALLMAEELPLAALAKPVSPAGTFTRALACLGEMVGRTKHSRRAR
jgi:pyruvate/2-oxoglutarate dehydrogenase complex dihydrolipoamide dehydrogenase (E3) component